MQSYIQQHIDGYECKAISEISKRGVPRTTCYDGQGNPCAFWAGSGCSMTSMVHTQEAPSCTPTGWLNKIGAETQQFGGFGGSDDQLNHFLEDQINRRSMELVNELFVALTQTFVNAGMPPPTNQHEYDTAFRMFANQIMVLVKLTANMGSAMALKNTPTKQDIETGAIRSLDNENLEKIDNTVTQTFDAIRMEIGKLQSEMREDDQPVSAKVSRKEVKRLRQRIAGVEKKLDDLTSALLVPPTGA
jgi:hypothetical protein